MTAGSPLPPVAPVGPGDFWLGVLVGIVVGAAIVLLLW